MATPSTWVQNAPTAAMEGTTLRQALTQRKSIAQCHTTASRNTTNVNWPRIRPNGVEVWTEFSLETVNEAYGHILDRDTLGYPLTPPQADQVPSININSDDDINRMVKWNHEVMQATVPLGQMLLGLQPGVLFRQELSDGHQHATADHTLRLDDFPHENLVVGLGKTSRKWGGKKLLAAENNNGLLWPVQQLGNLCRTANTRYGYLQTDQELVVCCFFRLDDTEGLPSELKVKMMPIPWSRHGPNTLTTDLALFFVTMLAMSAPENRIIVKETDVPPIGSWSRALNVSGAWVRKHHYSKFEVAEEGDQPNLHDLGLFMNLGDFDMSFVL